MREAAAVARQGDTEDIESLAKGLFRQMAPNVSGTHLLFTPLFLQHMSEELRHLQDSGIPTRRPNGMNRYGSILGEVGFEGMITQLISHYIAPLAGMLYPDAAVKEDVSEHFAFTVRYKVAEDLSLKEHTDAAVLTMNLCLGDEFKGGDLLFSEYRPWGQHKLPQSPKP